jgi:hypothetical protein
MSDRHGSQIHPEAYNHRSGRWRGLAVSFGVIAVRLGILFGD